MSVILARTHLVLLSMSDVREAVSNNRARKSGTQSLSLSAELNMHCNRHFLGLFVVHMPSCLHVLPSGGERTVTLRMFPRGCEDTGRRWLLFKGEGGAIPQIHESVLTKGVNWPFALHARSVEGPARTPPDLGAPGGGGGRRAALGAGGCLLQVLRSSPLAALADAPTAPAQQ